MRFIVRDIKVGTSTAFQVLGYHPDGTRVRQRFETKVEARQRADELNLQSEQRELSAVLRQTRLNDAQLRESEWAFDELAGRPTAVRFIMNILRTGGRSGSDAVIYEPGNAHFQDASLLPKDFCRTQGNPPQNLINDCQSLIKRSA